MDITERILRALSHQRIIEPEWGTEEIEITEADWQFIGERYQHYKSEGISFGECARLAKHEWLESIKHEVIL